MPYHLAAQREDNDKKKKSMDMEEQWEKGWAKEDNGKGLCECARIKVSRLARMLCFDSNHVV